MKNEKQPHSQRYGKLKNGNPPCDLSALPRCDAIAKHSQERCKQPAMANGKCRFHGGKSTGPPVGNKNAFRHGLYTAEVMKEKKAIAKLIRNAKKTLRKL